MRGRRNPRMETAVACKLTDRELRERKDTSLRKLLARVEEVKDLDSGYALRFPTDDSVLVDLVEVVRLERQCCPFLRFRIEVAPADGPIWLELAGPEGTRDFLRGLLELPA
jgi:hypothetical protein